MSASGTGTKRAPHERPTDARAPAEMARLHEHMLVQQGLRILRSEASRLARSLGGSVGQQELEELGHLPLVKIVRAFDASRGPFAPYATLRLRWALLDALRRESHGRVAASRAVALTAIDRGSAPGAASTGRPGPDAAIPAPLDQLRGLLRQQAGTIAVALVAACGDLADAEDPAASPEQLVARRQAAGRLWSAVRELPAPQRQLVERHYAGGEPFERIAADMGVSKGWASRLHAQAVRALAAALPSPKPLPARPT